MERAKSERQLARRNFTISANKLSELQKCPEPDIVAITAQFKMLSKCYEDLCKAQNKVINLWLDDETRDDSLLERDMDMANEYNSRWYMLETLMGKITTINAASPTNSRNGTVIENNSIQSARNDRHYRLPKLELPTFNGEIKGWLSFWTQFKKIHQDEMIDDDDKLQYLLQCMEPGSSARVLVECFPPSGSNYQAVIEQIKQRFARDEMIIEHYVRELLQLVLAQAKGTLKSPIRSLYDRITTQILALESLGVTQDKYAAFLYPLVESALPEELLRAWHRSHFHSESEVNSLSKLLQFVKQEVLSDERVRLARSFSADSSSLPSTSCFTTTSDKQFVKQEPVTKACLFCDKTTHVSSECVSAVNKTLDERRAIVKSKKACSICLSIGHYWRKCRRNPKCVICTKRHFPIMCQQASGKAEEDKVTTEPTSVSINQSTTNKTVLLQTLKVKLVTDTQSVVVRALLDSGAQRSFIRSEVAKKLGLKPVGEQDLSHNVFGGAVIKRKVHKLYNVRISSLESSYHCNIDVLEQEKICGYLPQLRSGKLLSKLEGLGISISDSSSDHESEVSLLIGSDVLGSLLTGRSVRVTQNLLAMESRFGWTIQGPAVDVYCATVESISTMHCSIEELWDLETMGIKDDVTTQSRKTAEAEIMRFFEETVRRVEDGRYEVRLPWKDLSEKLQPNFDVALKRLNSTTAKLTKMGILKDYNDVFDEWLKDRIIEVVENDDYYSGHYLPHHAVVKASSTTTKIRPVFDASSKDYNGRSLNTRLEKGINLIEMIPKLLIDFRRNAIGISADIKKAFLQILLHPDDRNYVKFLWWDNVNGEKRELKTFRHQRVVFGVTTSPFLLSATILHHLDNDESDIAGKLRKSFYVDNCLVSVKSEEEMKRFITESKRIMMEGQFELRCWVTGPVIIDEEVTRMSVLGLLWDPRNDELFCKLPHIKNLNAKHTKRSILSLAQSVFDPIGFVTPVALVPKLLLQRCWILNLDWDKQVPQDIAKEMDAWSKELQNIEACRIPRRISRSDVDVSQNSLHVFCDASLSAYACCMFLRSELKDTVDVQLVLARSRVAPTKSITMPRLELLAAWMGAKLSTQVKETLEASCTMFYWTDSSIVLAWLRRKEGLNVFVHNRVQEILQRTSIDDWRHVPGDKNPADLPSRGCNAEKLRQSQWWYGPDWLRKPLREWPMLVEQPDEQEVLREVKRSFTVVNEACVEPFSTRLLYFGKYTKLIRMIGWCHRFSNNCRTLSKKSGDLGGDEYISAEKSLLRVLQFEDEDSITSKVTTFKDKDGLLRVKTRLTFSDDTENFIHPVALVAKNPIVERLVLQEHLRQLHAGSQTLINNLRENYWIIGIRRLAKKAVKACVKCRRESAKSCNTPPGPLPYDRVNCGSAFEVTGIDLAGPLFLKSRQKCWIVLFTCAIYRAVHLELTNSLSSEDFMLALRRFLARRGNVRVIYSDNATNFDGASNVFDNLDQSSVDPKITWRFIPPSPPWWGGFWERMVRTLKEILRRSLGKAALSETELYTVLCEAEKVINSRPLTYVPGDEDTFQPLTPAMFLTLGCSKSSGDCLDQVDGNILSARWRYVNTVSHHLKERFRYEYLAALTQRNAESKAGAIHVGDVVLIGSDDTKRVNWPLALVVELIKEADGHCRVARLRTKGGTLTRPLQRLYRLEATADSLPEDVVTRTRSGRSVKLPQRLRY